MAFDSEIRLRVKVENLERETKRLEKALKKYTGEANDLKITDDAGERSARRKLDILKSQTAELRKQQTAAKNLNKRFESVALGVGFPALFGGGPGSILGSAAGSFVGTGFGGQILGGAIGAAFDRLGESGRKLVQNLQEPSRLLEELSNQGYKVSRSLIQQVEALEKQGRVADAARLANEQLVRSIGTDAVDAFKDFDQASRELSDSFGKLATTIFTETEPAITYLTERLAKFFEFLRGDELARAFANENPQRFQELTTQAADTITRRPDFGKDSTQDRINLQNELNRLIREEQALKTDTVTVDGTLVAQQNRSQQLLNQKLNSLRIEEELLGMNADLSSKAVYEKRKELIISKAAADRLAANGDMARIEIINQKEKIAKKELELERNDQLIEDAKKLAEEEAKVAVEVAKRAAERARELLLMQKTVTLAKERANLETLSLQEREAGVLGGPIGEAAQKVKNAQAELAARRAILEVENQKLRTDAVGTGYEQQVEEIIERRILLLEEESRLNTEEAQRLVERLKLEQQINQAIYARETAILGSSKGLDIYKKEQQLASPFGLSDDQQRDILGLEQEIAKAKELEPLIQSIKRAKAELATSGLEGEALAVAKQDIKLQEDRLALLTQRIDKEQELDRALLDQKLVLEKLQPVTDALAAGMSDIFTSIIDGSKSAEEAFSDMLKNMGKALIDMATKALAQQAVQFVLSLFQPKVPAWPAAPPIPGFASGGSVQGNQPIVVGERGPELFLPHQSGYIQSNTATRASLSQNSNQPRTIRFETTMINNVEYVTKEEAMMIGKQAADDGARRGAKMGQTQTLSGLRNSRSQRSKLGMR